MLDQTNASEYFDKFDAILKEEWQAILSKSKLVNEIKTGCCDKSLYASYLIETFHYTSHNAKNQALVVQNITESTPSNINYMKACLKHAFEEAGHELMAFHDLKALGYADIKIQDLPAPLTATEALIAYLYRVSTTGNPVQRLGYSYWAEGSYAYFGDVLATAARQMQIPKKAMTFFIEHGEIDAKHIEEIKETMSKICKSNAEWESAESVMLSSLRLTGAMLDDVHTRWLDHCNGKIVNFRF